MQELLIEEGLIKWVVNLLSAEAKTLSEYTLEYSTALLMNITLDNFGKAKVEEIAVKFITVMRDLLNHPNDQIKSFCSGTLYSVVSRTAIKQQALKMNLDGYLNELILQSPSSLSKYYSYTLKQLQETQPQEDDNYIMDEVVCIEQDENDNDIMEDQEIGEEDEFEDHFDGYTGPLGEELLCNFQLEGKEAENVF